MSVKLSSISLGSAKRFAGRYRYSIGIIALLFVVWGAGFVAVWNQSEKKRLESIAVAEQNDKEIGQTIERLLREKRERFEAEEKAKKAAEAEAKKKAEEEEKNAPEPSGGSNSSGSNCNQASSHANPASTDVMVNKKHCLIPLNFIPPDLVTTHGATISAKAADEFNKMFAAAAAAGQPFIVSSSYRSYETQVSTYNYWVSLNGQAAADTVSARPGFSEHQTGFSIDVGANGCNLDCFGGTSQHQWFQTNAHKYGFIQRYYSGFEGITGYAGEEWHYRYVGVATAQDMRVKGIKTLEQYWSLEGGGYR